jgi:hypothetical protein
MTTLKHFKWVDDALNYIWNGTLSNFIIIKNETIIVDTSNINGDTFLIRRSQLRNLLSQ